MNPLSVHLICVGLVMADLLARAWRIQWLVRGVGYRVSFGQAFTVNALGDAACALSPLRIAGEPARLATLLRAGVPATGAFVAITYEVLAAWPVIIVGAGILAWLYAPEWWASTAPQIGKVVRDFWPVAVLAAILTLAVWLWVRRAAPAASTHFKRPLRRILVHWRRMPRWPVMASIPMSVTNLVSRVAILPVLASTLPHPPSLGPMLVGSFALLYSQMILPTPSGAGAVDLIFVAGAAGTWDRMRAGCFCCGACIPRVSASRSDSCWVSIPSDGRRSNSFCAQPNPASNRNRGTYSAVGIWRTIRPVPCGV